MEDFSEKKKGILALVEGHNEKTTKIWIKKNDLHVSVGIWNTENEFFKKKSTVLFTS